MILVPAEMPVTVPLLREIAATESVPLAHVPPPASLKVIEEPVHTGVLNNMGCGSVSTVNIVVLVQPVGNV